MKPVVSLSKAAPGRSKALCRRGHRVHVCEATYDEAIYRARNGPRSLNLDDAEFEATRSLVWLSAICLVHRLRRAIKSIDPKEPT